jgi:Ca2+-transporting ATPase
MDVEITHQLPGRLRVIVKGLQNQAVLAYRLQVMLKQIDGIRDVQCNPDTGRALICFDERRLTPERVVQAICSWTVKVADTDGREAVAATIEADLQHDPAVTKGQQVSLANPYLVPTIASSALLGGLSLKRLFMGRSVLATSPVTFWASAAVSVAAGYPALRRGMEHLIHHRKASPDLWIGLGTLAMAAVRENLVALSVITALNYAMYRRYNVLSAPEDTHLPPEIEHHSRRMSRLSLWLAPLSLLLTRSPLRAIGVALAANPRPVILSHKYRWAQAEREAYEKNLLVSTRCGLSALASAKTIVLSDENLILGSEEEWRIQPVNEKFDAGKATAIAASLVQKCDNHPWRYALVQRALREQRTFRTAFDVECQSEGIRGSIQGHEILLGTREFIKKYGVDTTPILMEERRMRRQGFFTQILVVESHPVAIFGCKRDIDSEWKRMFDEWQKYGYSVRSLQKDPYATTLLEPMTMDQLSNELEMGNTTIVIGDEGQLSTDHPCFIPISPQDGKRLSETLAFCRETGQRSQRDVAIVKAWNFVGVGLALAAPVTAPLIALTGDVVSMFLIAAQDWTGRIRARIRERLDTSDKTVCQDGSRGRRSGGGHSEPFHALEVSELLDKLGSSISGLTSQQVSERLQMWGANVLASPEPPSSVRIFLNQFKDLSMLILLGTAGLSFVMGERFSALCMGGILVVNALVATWQELRSTTVIQALKMEDNSQTKVIRDGTEQLVSTKELVPGDVVLLESGDKVPADIRVMEAWNLEVNEAMLTGESVPVVKDTVLLPLDTPAGDRSNSLFMGTVVTRGRCKGVVVATGKATEIGQLDLLINEQEEEPTFLQQRVTQISKRFVIGAIVAASVVAVAGLLRGIPPVQLLISSVTLAASAIPEGLPLTITVALTAGVLTMSKRRAVIKKLANLESLGRVTVICCDKTGTLTKNEMTVKELVTVRHRIRVTGDAQSGQFCLSDQPDVAFPVLDDADTRQLLTIGMLCNNARIGDEGTEPTGDPTEAALLTVAEKANLHPEIWKRQREIPFDSATRSMSVICEEDQQAHVVCEEGERLQRCTIFSKGAPEEILQKCTHYLAEGEVRPMTEEVNRQIREENLRMADQALRVLACAYRNVNDDEDPLQVVDNDLIYVGLMGMMDPPKEGVATGIQEARKLGIKPVMITGDHPFTARAIAAEIGIFQPGDRILTGKELDQLSQEDLDRLIVDTSIFARVSPEHKLRIVEAFQRIGEVVAMTGDGVNDAPAIRKADVGIAMGLKGTDITRGTAGIVLLEDHFHSIVDGVKGGRAIIGNIRKAMGCLLAGNLAEVLVTAVSIIVGLPMPLIPLQILLMNILTDAIPAMVLATGPQNDIPEKPYKDVIDRELYRTFATRGCVLGLGAVAVFAAALAAGMPLPLAQTMTYASLVVGQLMQTVAWRRYGTAGKGSLKKDRVLLTATIGSWLALAATIYVPGLRTVFATVPLGIPHWGMVFAVTGTLTWMAQRWIDWFSNRERSMSPMLRPTYCSSM